MSLAQLPAELQGEWIWTAESSNEIDDYVLFRGEFTLEEIPTAAELWVASGATYHLYINGRHVCRGPHPSNRQTMMVALHEVAYCLQFGHNAIAILAHNERVSRFFSTSKPGALWCQLNVDGKMCASTSSDWLSRQADYFLPRQPRVSAADGFVESVDLRKFPYGWRDAEYETDDSWTQPASLGHVQGGPWKLAPLPDVERISEQYNFLNLVIHGRAKQGRASTVIQYPAAQDHAGVYVAETYVQSGSAAKDIAFQLLTDDPFYLFVNHELVVSRGNTGDFPNWSDPRWSEPQCYGQGDSGVTSGRVEIKKGANHVKLVQQVGRNSCGATFVFPEVEAGAFRFTRGTDSISMPGWMVSGPINTPFVRVREDMALFGCGQEPYFGKEFSDAAAYLISHEFAVEEVQEEGLPIDEVELVKGQYMILEFERYTRCVPEIEFNGQEGDIIDIVYGDSLDGALLNPVKGGVRKVYSVILPDGGIEWHGVTPHGMQYMMIFCRQAQGQVSISNVCARRTVSNFREPASFTCSDELMNQIWEIGQNTLTATYDSIFLNAAGHQEYQFLADAMIQSCASFYTMGGSDLSERALRDFAEAQYETGEMPVVAPGDISVRLLDSMLLWPVWLSRHFLHSGDRDFVKEMLPHLQNLLAFFEDLMGDNPCLGNANPPYDNDCIIDYDDSIDRKGISTALNGFYCYALLKAGWIYEQMEDHDKMHYCGKRAANVAKAVRDLTWNEDKGLFADSWYEGKAAKNCSMQSNVIALASGIARESDYSRIFNNIFIEYAPFQNLETDPHSDNPYFKFFLLDMAYALGHREWATDFMRYYWGSMIQRGAQTWWERFSPELGDDQIEADSLCHGYGVSANYFIITEVLGLRPVDPGYYQVYFDPHLTAVEWATASIPTPHGNIKIDWRFLETGQLEVTIEASYPLEVVPQLDKAVASDTVLKVGDNVNILS